MLANRGLVSLALLISLFGRCLGQTTNANATTGNATTGNTTAENEIATLGSAISGEEYGLLRRLLTDTNLTSTLVTASNVTLFAPSNDAFQATAGDLGSPGVDEEDAYTAVASALNALGSDAAVQVVQYHVLTQRRTLEQLEVGNPERTLNGFFLKVDNTTSPTSIEHGSAEQARPELDGTIQITDDWSAFQVNRIILPFIVRAPSSEQPRVAAVISPTPSPGSRTAITAGNNTDNTANAGGGDVGSVCFPGNSLVTLANGDLMRMDELSAGNVLQVDEVGHSSTVYAFTHRMPYGFYDFVQLQAKTGTSVTLSAAHLLYANGRLTRADSVRVGDWIRTVHGARRVLKVGRIRAAGLYAPHTMHGDLVVDNVVVSSYTALFRHNAAHAAMAPIRALVRAGIREPLGGIFDNGWPKVLLNLSQTTKLGWRFLIASAVLSTTSVIMQ